MEVSPYLKDDYDLLRQKGMIIPLKKWHVEDADIQKETQTQRKRENSIEM